MFTHVYAQIHRITARFKALLHECHYVGNLTHKTLVFYSITVVNVIQMISGIYIANIADAEGGLVSEVPTWSFAVVLQPVVTVIVFLFGFGNLNLAIERDIDQDIVEMNIRLTYSETFVPNWLLQQMICLERLDGRAFGLPMNIIPSVEMARRLTGNAATAFILLMPYLLSITDKLSSELVVLREYAGEEVQ